MEWKDLWDDIYWDTKLIWGSSKLFERACIVFFFGFMFWWAVWSLT